MRQLRSSQTGIDYFLIPSYTTSKDTITAFLWVRFGGFCFPPKFKSA